MTRRLVVASVLLAAFVLLIVELPLGLTYAGRQEDRLLADVERDARVLAGLIEEQLEHGDVTGTAPTVEQYASQSGGRVVVTDSEGISLVDTDADGGSPRDFSTRPEVEAALAGSQAAGIRRSETLDDELAYVAVPVTSGPLVTGAVRVSFSTGELRDQVRENWAKLGLLSALVLASAAGFGWLVARWAVAPVRELDSAAGSLAEGDLGVRVQPDHGPPELRRLSSTFNDMARRLESLVGSQRAFVADASHQLRTPLTALRLRLDGIDDLLDAGDAERARQELGEVDRELDRLNQLVEGLLALARAEATKTAPEEVDVHAIARDAAARWGDLAAESDLHLVVSGTGTAPAMALPGAVEQILDNLLDNAFDAAPTGSTIEVSVTGGPDVALSVRDHGRGMTADERARATDRFWRAPGAPAGGTGLGLAIVGELARASGGQVHLEAPPDGDGLVVRVTFPGPPAAT